MGAFSVFTAGNQSNYHNLKLEAEIEELINWSEQLEVDTTCLIVLLGSVKILPEGY